MRGNVTGVWNVCFMENPEILETAQIILRNADEEVLTPRAGECLGCFAARQLGEFGCNGTHRFVTLYRDRTAPRATALIRRLSRMGACCCDCEIFMNAYVLAHRFVTPGYWFTDAHGQEAWEDPKWPEQLPECHKVRRGSTQLCEIWERRYRGYGYW